MNTTNILWYMYWTVFVKKYNGLFVVASTISKWCHDVTGGSFSDQKFNFVLSNSCIPQVSSLIKVKGQVKNIKWRKYARDVVQSTMFLGSNAICFLTSFCILRYNELDKTKPWTNAHCDGWAPKLGLYCTLKGHLDFPVFTNDFTRLDQAWPPPPLPDIHVVFTIGCCSNQVRRCRSEKVWGRLM